MSYMSMEEPLELKQFLIACYLGDGSFTKISGGAKNSRLSIAHSKDQKEYAIRKWELLNRYNLAGKLSENRIENTRYKNGFFEEVRFKSKANPIFNKYRELGYDETKKKLNTILINKINGLGLALWFMDDGNRTNNSCEINCQKFNEEEKYKLKFLLEEVFIIIKFNVTKNTLYLPSQYHFHFKSIVRPYMLDSLMYKLNPYKGSV